ncbi:hypothetical protein M9Y10_025213 [Tritrichomonas musculus]|uniref:Protein kinase domain-containing protein n=1 Tax=Tritrichomonas musculus TaxID=1915356 RepID=A0ABR2H9X7_9EUKA
MAPELFEDEGHFSTGIDVYAFAILAYEIVSGQEPYKEKGKSISMANLVRKVLSNQRPKFVDNITEPMWELLTRCWSKDPNERPSFEEIFQELSTNFSLFDEDVDEDEIRDYLDYLADENKEESVTKASQIKEDFVSKYDQLVKKEEKDNKIYSEILIKLIGRQDNIDDLYFSSIGGNILHLACESGNLELVKYIISLDKIDITSKAIFIYFS